MKSHSLSRCSCKAQTSAGSRCSRRSSAGLSALRCSSASAVSKPLHAASTAAHHQQHPGLHIHTADQQQLQLQLTAAASCVHQQQQQQVAAAVVPAGVESICMPRFIPGAAAATLPVFLTPLLWADSAAAATVCLDVPDWLVDWRGTLFHSPVVAVGAAGLALVLFPKLIRTAINYLAIPAILAMLVYAAVSFPETTANTIYTVLEFIKQHPTASSIGIIVGAGVLLGPDLLAGTAVAGVLALLAVKLGILQMPQLPQLPKVPGQALLSRQLDNAGKALRERIDDLDDGRDDLDDSVRVRRGALQKYNGRDSRMIDVQAVPVPQAAAPLPAAAAEVLANGPQQEQQQDGALALPGLGGFKGFAQQLGSTAKTLGSAAVEKSKTAGTAALQQGKQLRDSEEVQQLSQQAAEAAGKAARATKQAAGGLWQRGKEALTEGKGLQVLKQGTAAVVGRAKDAAQGLGSKVAPGVEGLSQAGLNVAAVEEAPSKAAVVGRTQQEIDSILANS